MKSNRFYFLQKTWGQAALLATAGVLLYLPSITHTFVYDDNWTIVRNAALDQVIPIGRFFLDADTAAYPPSGISRDVYRPLATLSFAVQKSISESPGFFRLFNIFLHALNGVLLWIFLRPREKNWLAVSAALFFLAHPLAVESVVWITQRSILLCATFCLLTLISWDRAVADPRAGWAACGFFALALFSKETALMLPVVLAMQLEGRSDRRWKSFLTCVPIALGYYLLRRHVIGSWGQPVQFDVSGWVWLGDGFTALGHYLQKIVWPFGLNVSYRAPDQVTVTSPGLWIGMIVLTGLCWTVSYFFHRRRTLALGAMMFLVFWLPHSGLTPLVTFAADRFMYLPLLGAAIIFSRLLPASSKGLILMVFIAVFLAVCSLVRMQDWKDEKSLWTASIRVDPRNPFALACLAQELEREGDEYQAEEYYKQALANRPTIGLARSVLTILIRMNERRSDPGMADFWRKKLATVPR